MTPRRPINQTAKPPDIEDGKAEVKFAVNESDAREFDAIADDLDISPNTLIYEGIAQLLTDHGKGLPAPLVEHLEAHGRPLPPGAKRAAKVFRFH
jgi:hypothetical protein